jgi:Polyketide cyclase / dehydrase and lipid transport
MTTKVEKSVEVNVPVSTAYNQWTQFEEFPRFMGGVEQVRQISDRMLHWVAEIAGVKREWDAAILEQVPDQKVAWAATQGATNAGAVFFQELGPSRTLVRLSMEYEPEGFLEQAGDALSIVSKRAEADLEKFKAYIESRGVETGAWRGSINEGLGVGTPGVEQAATRETGSSGGVSGKAVAAGAAVAAAGVGVAAGAAAAVRKSRSDDETDRPTTAEPVTSGDTEYTGEAVSDTTSATYPSGASYASSAEPGETTYPTGTVDPETERPS